MLSDHRHKCLFTAKAVEKSLSSRFEVLAWLSYIEFLAALGG